VVYDDKTASIVEEIEKFEEERLRRMYQRQNENAKKQETLKKNINKVVYMQRDKEIEAGFETISHI
jgi:hypothetical protein